MKIKIIDENNFILFIIDSKMIPNVNCEKELSEYLKNIFEKIKDRYKFEVCGYYDVIIYINKIYGMIIKLKKEDSEYLDYNKQIEMKIVIEDNNVILYKINDFDDLDKNILLNSNIYLYDKELYLELTDSLEFILLGQLLEFADIVFENTEFIKKRGEKIEIG